MARNSLVFATVLCLAFSAAHAADTVSPAIAAAIADAGRPASDKDADAKRKPAESVAFSGVKPGDTVVDLIPGTGYFTRIFSKTVGASGQVYAINPVQLAERMPALAKAMSDLAADPAYKNVTVLNQDMSKASIPGKADVVWTSQNYHDLHNPMMRADMQAFNTAVFSMLKPGGVFIVLDHRAAAGTGFSVTETLHRADADAVKAEVLKAGFAFDGESNVLANAADDHSKGVRDASIRGHTDQFIFRFKKPAR